jgi:hypothetical protein
MSHYEINLSVSEKYISNNNIIEVDRKSDVHLYEEVYKIATYFHEEFDYTHVPFCPLGYIDAPKLKYKALLFTKEAPDKHEKEPTPHRIYGACLFTVKEFTEDKDYWLLQWIWIHPFFRHRGNLKKTWNKLEEKFDNFLIASPISNDMNAFLENINSKYEHEIM